MAAKFQQLQDLFPDANVVSMVESDATVLMYDYTSVGVKVILPDEMTVCRPVENTAACDPKRSLVALGEGVCVASCIPCTT